MIDANGFDREFYLARYPDIAKAGIDPYQHFLQYGWKEGRNPNLVFDTRFYLRSNGDVAKAGINPLEHYVKYGWKEGRDPSAAFDTSDYLSVYADVSKAGLNPMLHYLQYGMAEKRPLPSSIATEIKEGFDRVSYLKFNPDVAKAGIEPYLHFVQFGNAEGRSANPLFDKAFYLAQNPDVARAGADPLEHFMTFGWREGRSPSAAFNLTKYVAPFGFPAGTNPLIYVLTTQRYGLQASAINATPDGPIRPGDVTIFNPLLIGSVTFTVDGNTIHTSAPGNLIDGRDLLGFKTFWLSSSQANFTIQGSGELPVTLELGSGDDRMTGVYDLPYSPPGSGTLWYPFTLKAGEGKLTVDATFNKGAVSIYGGEAGSTVTLKGDAQAGFYGGRGDDVVSTGSSPDTLSGGGGTNVLNGGDGSDTATWATAVRADLLTGLGVSLGSTIAFRDTLISIENLAGSSGSDILLGDDSNNTIGGGRNAEAGSDPIGHDFIAGRGGNDYLGTGTGNDTLLGGAGSDNLDGGGGDDLLIDGQEPAGPYWQRQTIYGGDGNDRLVFQLGSMTSPAQDNLLLGQFGADTFILDPSRGSRGTIQSDFNQADGDKLDLSALRSATGAVLTLSDVLAASSLSSANSTVINLSAFRDTKGNVLSGSITLDTVVVPLLFTLKETDFIFTATSDWHSSIPPEFLPLI